MADATTTRPDRGTDGGPASPARRLAARADAFRDSPWSVPVGLDGRHSAPISLSSGAPAPELVPTGRLAEAARQVWAEPNQWGYAGVGGYHPLRDWLAGWLEPRGVRATADEIVLTTGSQQGIDLVARLFLDAGDTVIVEGPTYIGALQVFDACGADYLVAPMDEGGLDVETLAATLDDRAARGEAAPRLLYTVPTFQNPTGRLLGDARRDALLALARRHGIAVVEDDPYGELWFDAAPPGSLRARDPDVIALGTFSKTLAPALRMGWAVLPPDLAPLVANGREVLDVHGDRMSQRVVAYTVHDFLDGHVAWLRERYAARCRRLAEALAATLPEGVRVARPGGGFFLWLDLPDGSDAAALMPEAADHGVMFLPGGWSYPDRRPDPGLRLSFSNVPEESLGEGAARLSTAIRAALAVGALAR